MASLFQGLLKTPEQVRQEEQKALQERGLTAAAMLTQGGGGTTGLPGLLKGFGANIAQNIDTQAANLKQRGLLGLGSIAGAMGNQEAQSALGQAAMSPAERQAMQERAIAQEASKTKDPARLRTIAARLSATNPAAAMALSERADQLEAAAAKADREERTIAVSEGNLKVAQDTLQFNKDKAAEPTKFRTVKGDEAVKLGLPAGGVYQINTATNELKKLYEPPKDSAGLKGERWAEDPNTGETFLVGTLNGKLVRVTDDGLVPQTDPIKPVKQITKVDDPANAIDQLDKQLARKVGDIDANIKKADELRLTLNEARNNPKALPQLERMLVEVAGRDKQVALKEIERVMGTGDLATRLADTVSKGITGTLTEGSYNDILQFVDKLTEYREGNREKAVSSWYAMYSSSEDQNIREAAQYVADSYLGGGDDALVNQYLKEARGE
jgi:hypothetical protein